jgi:hypothetical protein
MAMRPEASLLGDTADLRARVDAAQNALHAIRIALIHRTDRKTGRVAGSVPGGALDAA